MFQKFNVRSFVMLMVASGVLPATQDYCLVAQSTPFRSTPFQFQPVRDFFSPVAFRFSDEGDEGAVDDAKSDKSLADRLKDEKADDKKEPALADSLRVANLHSGIDQLSMQRAVGKRDIADPNIEFVSNATPAMLEYGFNGCVVYKTWDSPNVWYRPLYFEEPNIERYGNTHGQHLQPYLSGIHFMTNVMTMPYNITARRPCEREYGLGYGRPGNCNSAYRPGIERSPRGAAVQALTIGGILAGL